MKILDIYAKGYAGATMGGTSFMVNIEVEEGRFLDSEQNDGYMLNILVPNPGYGTEPRFRLSSKLVDKEDGSISLWGEEEEFNSEELKTILTWCADNQIETQASLIKLEIEVVKEKLDEIRSEFRTVLKTSVQSLTDMEEKQTKMSLLNEEMELLERQYERLHGA